MFDRREPGGEHNPFDTIGTGGDGGPMMMTGTSGGIESTGMVLEMGELWCLSADAAEYVNGGGTAVVIQPYVPGDTRGPEGCYCMPPEFHEVLDMEKNAPPMYHGNVAAETECVVTRVVMETPPPSTCTMVGGPYGITYNTDAGEYELPQSTFDHFHADPSCLMEESGRITINSSNEYQFDNIGKGEFLSELGLEDGDVPVSINSYDLDTPAKALTAYTNVHDATSWTGADLILSGEADRMDRAVV
jgi:hypothetical protein